MINYQSKFSHIYVEDQARDFALSKLVLKKFKNSEIIQIRHYKDIFNRTNQDFQVQKRAMKLILAKKTGPLLYPATDMVQDYKNKNSFYNTPALNCLYNCEYCFLQGMYPSGHLVLFVNENDFFIAINKQLLKLEDPTKPMIVSISYNTDLMAMENLFPIISRWIEFAKSKDNLIIEIRTKSALFNSLKNISPHKNIILSWTLSPEVICKEFEKFTPSLEMRIKAVKSALDAGWDVRLCFDPILILDDWEKIYCLFIDQVMNKINYNKLRDLTLGVFRMNKNYFNRIKKSGLKSRLYYEHYANNSGTITLEEDLKRAVIKTMKNKIIEYLPAEKVMIWD